MTNETTNSDLQSLLRSAEDTSQRIIELGDEVDGALVFDTEVLRKINGTGKALQALESALTTVFATISSGKYPVSETTLSRETMKSLRAVAPQITDAQREAAVTVLQLMEQMRATLADSIPTE